MRITGGQAAGIRIETPPGVVRPAMDRMRESLFSILGDIEELSFLDLFSGSGIVGLEALSRGASRVTLVERDRGKRATMQANLEAVLGSLNFEPEISLVTAPVERYLLRVRKSFDIVYLDPPFDYRYKSDLLRRLARSGALSEKSRAVMHYPGEEKIDPAPLVVTDERRYGRSRLLFLSPFSS
ncbi:MAG: 16S rRNA (guanine(966)-N(2))-methyltransferase RsmD [Spirochaetaceae bacterium]